MSAPFLKRVNPIGADGLGQGTTDRNPATRFRLTKGNNGIAKVVPDSRHQRVRTPHSARSMIFLGPLPDLRTTVMVDVPLDLESLLPHRRLGV
jgi:hypothetical protein